MTHPAPSIQTRLNFPTFHTDRLKLANGIPTYIIRGGTQDVIRITCVTEAGSRYQSYPLVAYITGMMLTEGTADYTSTRIAEAMDYCGALLSVDSDCDFSYVTLMVLRKYLPDVLPVMCGMLSGSVFSEDMLHVLKDRLHQRFLVQNKRGRVIAHKLFGSVLYGPDHPYGAMVSESDFQNVTQIRLKDFFNRRYTPEHMKIVLDGVVKDEDVQMIDHYLGQWQRDPIPHPQRSGDIGSVDYMAAHFMPSPQKRHAVAKSEDVQTAVRIGRTVCSQSHMDYPGLQLLNMILGGYFGSRLMQNLREDKGYTYGIHSMIVPMLASDYLTIVSEIGQEYTQSAIREIYKEISRLQQEPVSDTELLQAKRYAMGEMLRSFDGPFAQGEQCLSLINYDLPENFYTMLYEGIQDTSQVRLQELAQQYLKNDTLYEIVVGRIGPNDAGL